MVEMPAGLASVLPALACPHCGVSLDADTDGVVAVLMCVHGHAFDVARQGYVSLLSGAVNNLTVDDAEMISARERFFATGHYNRFQDAVASAAGLVPAHLGPILDCGAGEGSYLARALSTRGGNGIAVDLAKPAGRRNARRGPAIGSVVANCWGTLPIADHGVGVVLSVFAPRNSAEFARVLVPDGALVVLTPTRRHLHQIVGPLSMISVAEGKVTKLDSALHEKFELLSRERHEWIMDLDSAAIADLVAMGPSHRHGSAVDRRDRIAELTSGGTVPVTASGTVSVYRPR